MTPHEKRNSRLRQGSVRRAIGFFEHHPDYATVRVEIDDQINQLPQNTRDPTRTNQERFALLLKRFDIRAEGFARLLSDVQSQNHFEALLDDWVRRTWFEYAGYPIDPFLHSPNAEIQLLIGKSRQWQTQGFRRIAEQRTEVRAQIERQQPKAESVLPSVPFFLSYAHADAADLERFRLVFEPLLNSSPKFQFSRWSDHLTCPGERWRDEIQRSLEYCKFGLLLVSPNFLASQFITGEELPLLLAKPMVVPVMLHRLLFDGLMDLKGLGERQVFRDSRGRAFDACTGMKARRDFAMELFQKINLLLDKRELEKLAG